jgi:hypothetical protein
MTVAPRVLHAVPIAVGAEGAGVWRAEIEVAGLDLAGPSFDLLIFLNNPGADAATQPTEDNGYAGSIYVYGYGRPPDSMRDDPGSRLPITRSVGATRAVRRALAHGPTASVTLVAIPADSPGPDVDLGPLEVTVLVDAQDPPI